MPFTYLLILKFKASKCIKLPTLEINKSSFVDGVKLATILARQTINVVVLIMSTMYSILSY